MGSEPPLSLVLLTEFQTLCAQVKSLPGSQKEPPFIGWSEADGWCWILLKTGKDHNLERFPSVLQGESSLADNKTSARCEIIQWKKVGGNGKK